MTTPLDETNRPELTSWVTSAQAPDTDFPIQNLPFGCVRRGADVCPAVAIGDQVLDLAELARVAPLEADLAPIVAACAASGALNPLLAAGRDAIARLRAYVSRQLRADTSEGQAARARASLLLTPLRDATLALPALVGDYTDFYASVHHATNVGSMFRPDNPLLPNYKWVPIGYHGRSSSIVPSGTAIHRPSGQTRDEGAAAPVVGPSRRLDYELEIGAYVATGNALGEPIRIGDAESHIAGLSLVNDW